MNDSNIKQDEVEIDLLELFQVLLSKAWIILLAGIIGVVSVGLFCKFVMTPIYSSTTQLAILSNTAGITSLADLQVGTQLTQDYIVVVQSRPVVEGVIERLDLDMKYEELLGATTVENPADTRILAITVQNEDPYLAKQIVDAYADISKKRIATLMDIAEPGIVEEGYVAENKTSPTTTKNALIAGVLLAFIACAIIIIRHLMDDTIKSSEDIEHYLGLNTLGILPIDEAGLKEEERERLAKEKMKRSKKESKRKPHEGGNSHE